MESKFINKYIKAMTQTMTRMNPDWDKDKIKKIVKEMTEKSLRNPVVILDNNFTGENRETTLLSVLDWTFDRKPIICGNATFYKNQYEAINPIAKMLEDFLSQRKAYKKQMFKIEDTSSAKYRDLDMKQNNEKINCNSYYGASGAPSSAFYSTWSGPATTHSAQQVIATAETLFEGFIADNYKFLNLTECIEWVNSAINPFVKEDETIDSWLQLQSIFDVRDRLLSHILLKEENDEIVLEKFLESFTDEELSVIYYKNNLLEFINDHENIKDMIIDIFEGIENFDYVDTDDDRWFQKIPDEFREDFVGKDQKAWNKFVNIQYFMDPNDVPVSILTPITRLKESLMKYVYCRYLSVDRIYRLRNFKRQVVTVIDTDSNILSLDTAIDFIFDTIVKDQSFGRSFKNNIFICINMLAYVLTEAVTDILLTYGEHSNIPEEFRPIYNMKNEFLFLRLVIGKAKKRYISKIVLREGNLMNPPKYDVKGFDFKKATTSEYAEDFYMKLLKEHIINSEEIELREILQELKDFKEGVIQSIKDGDKKFLPNLAAKEFGAYKNPYSQQSVKAVMAWNFLYPDNTIDLPSKISVLKLNIFSEDDIAPLKQTNPDIYNTIIENVFHDESGVFVKKTWNPGISYVNPNADKDGKWTEKIPKKYRSKYKKLGPKKWNEFVDTIDLDNPGNKALVEGSWEIKQNGLQVLGIPSNSAIPEWCFPYIDMSTIVNNIIAPFIPVLEIFQSKTVEEGKTKNGVNRKTRAFTNIVKF